MIVDSSALPEQVTRDVVASAFQSAGQRCSALRVLYLQDDVLVAANTVNNGRDIHVARECIAHRHRLDTDRLARREHPFEVDSLVSASAPAASPG